MNNMNSGATEPEYDSRLISQQSRAVYDILMEEINNAKPDDLAYLELQVVPITLRIVDLMRAS